MALKLTNENPQYTHFKVEKQLKISTSLTDLSDAKRLVDNPDQSLN